MYYSSVGILCFIIHLIIHRDALKKSSTRSEQAGASPEVSVRYRYFLIAAALYYMADLSWGILYDHKDINVLFPFIYSNTVFYFIFMLLTMLTWIRYVVSYLDKKGRRSKVLLYAVWSIFTLGLIYLMVNRFYPFIFSFTEDHVYVTEPGRYVAFILQILLYLVTSTYMFRIAMKSSGQDKVRYTAVGLTGFVLLVFQILQILNPIFPFYAMGLMIGSCVIHSYVEAGEKREKEVYDSIATALAEDYEGMFYIDIDTGEYRTFFSSVRTNEANVPASGSDYFTESQIAASALAHPDDREFAVRMYAKDTILKNLEGRRSFSFKYRFKIGEEYRFLLFTVIRANDDRHLILYVKDIEEDITAESVRLENQKKQVTFTRIAESLASNYDMIYYVDVRNSHYVSYATHNLFGQLEIQESGDDFFTETLANIPRIVHKNDAETVKEFLNRDSLITALEDKKMHSLDYRLMVGGKAQYCRMIVRKTSDGNHFIICVENVDAEVRKAKQQLKALNTEKELARRDELTGAKNKNAYAELEQSVQSNMDHGMDYLPFALVVCDANNLKKINDTLGHVAGDEYIKASAKLLCDIFSHSPVFRVGGDEFTVFLQGSDYANRQALFKKLRDRVLENQKTGSGPVIASGIAELIPETDSLVSEIFERADKEMYENKQNLKEMDGSSFPV